MSPAPEASEKQRMLTASEKAFEQFLAENGLQFDKIKEGEAPTPDYLVQIGNLQVMFEVKELAEDANYGAVKDPLKPEDKSYDRTIGDHVRKKIKKARKQVRQAIDQGIPAVLLIYNNLDPSFWYGTEDHDFITAMYGEYTISLGRKSGKVLETFQGRNQSLREDWSTEFSAVGRSAMVSGKLTVNLFENVFAKVKLPFEALPACFGVQRFDIDSSASLGAGESG